MRQEEPKKNDKNEKKSEVQLGKEDSGKTRKIIEENIKMKIKVRELIEQIKELEKDNEKNLEKYKLYLSGLNLEDKMKKELILKTDLMMNSKIASKLTNIMDLREHLNLDDMKDLNSNFFKNVIGDIISF